MNSRRMATAPGRRPGSGLPVQSGGSRARQHRGCCIEKVALRKCGSTKRQPLTPRTAWDGTIPTPSANAACRCRLPETRGPWDRRSDATEQRLTSGFPRRAFGPPPRLPSTPSNHSSWERSVSMPIAGHAIGGGAGLIRNPRRPARSAAQGQPRPGRAWVALQYQLGIRF